MIFFIAAALTILSSIHYVRQVGIHEGEFYALVLFATVGMILMAAANDLMVFFLGLETMSVAVYVLTGMWRASGRSSEAAMKYFLMGAFATGFLLYGIALIYGATGSTNLNRSPTYLLEQPSDWPLYLVGGGFLAAGRFCLQSRRRAVSFLGAGCLRRRADAGHRFHVGCGQSRGFRRLGAHSAAQAFAARQ